MLRRHVLVAGLLLISCSAAPADNPTIETGSPSISTTTTAAPTSQVTTTTSRGAAATTTSTTVVTTREPFIPNMGLREITAGSLGEGPRPQLTWDAVPGAATYSVLVMDPTGLPWWAWSGPDTQVVLGGVDTEADIGGPSRRAGLTWTVFAYDSDGAVVGVSSEQKLDG